MVVFQLSLIHIFEQIQEMKAKYPLTYDHSQLTGPYIIEKLYEITKGCLLYTSRCV